MNASVTISAERPDQPDVVRLLEARDAFSAALYPAESNHTLDLAELLRPEVSFFVARRDDAAVGCGALVCGGDQAGEVKSMFVDEAARGTGAGLALLERIEAEARAAGLPVLRLETGVDSTAARRLYEQAGYRYVEPFAPYRADPFSVFMEKPLPPLAAG
jgi:putative acetyltransferase